MTEFVDLLPLLGYLGLALTISFLCSLLESVLLSVKYSYIEMLDTQGNPAGDRLRKLKDHTDRSLAAILTLNTVAHTGGAVGVGSEVNKLFGEHWLTISSAIMTLLILVFSEVIPKSLGAANWKKLAPISARVVAGLIFIIYPLVWLLERISKFFQPKGYQEEVSREEMIAVAELGEGQGTIKPKESKIIKNLLLLDEVEAEDVMTPSTVMLSFGRNETVGEVVEKNKPIRFSRIPVLGNGINDVLGLALRHRILVAYSEGRKDVTMEELLDPIHVVSPEAPVGTLLDLFIKRQEQIFLVVDSHGGTEGIITLEDAIETLLGVEIVDEDDSVKDMRELAREMWRKRREQMVGVAVSDASSSGSDEEP
jgi:CBS domain containing-hemolysin-like protein